MKNIKTFEQLGSIKQAYNEAQEKFSHRIYVCAGAGCVSSNCSVIRDTVTEEIAALGLSEEIPVYETGCMGTCAVGPVMLILPERVFYTDLTEKKARRIIKAHITKGEVLERYTFFDESLEKHIPIIDDIGFFKNQVKIALRNCGTIEYASIDA